MYGHVNKACCLKLLSYFLGPLAALHLLLATRSLGSVYIFVHLLFVSFLQAGLIKMGAKFAPCMRVDNNLKAVLEEERRNESKTGCCVKSDGSGCIQTSQQECSVSLEMSAVNKIFQRIQNKCMYEARVIDVREK